MIYMYNLVIVRTSLLRKIIKKLRIEISARFWSIQWNLDLRKPDLRKNLDLRNVVGTTDFLVHKLFDLRKIF